MNGTIVTFYSYKGGAGRTMALANVAATLAAWGYSVLCVDWDVEAPGLVEYLSPHLLRDPEVGLVDLVSSTDSSNRLPWRKFVTGVHIPELGASFSLLPAGGESDSYPDRIQGLDWAELYRVGGLGSAIEQMREEWKEHFDFVLIDSRTGLSDVGGICTVQLPDIVLLFVTPNAQSLQGIKTLTRRADLERARLSLDRQNILYVPIAARVETRVEHSISQQWLQRLNDVFGPLVSQWADRDVKPTDVVKFCRVPYVPFFGFGERIAALEESDSGPDSLSYWFDNIAALLAHRLADTKVLISNRDSYVNEVRPLRAVSQTSIRRSEVLVSAVRGYEEIAHKIIDTLEQHGFEVAPFTFGDAYARALLEKTSILIQLIGERYTSNQVHEAETFIRQGLSSNIDRILLPVLLAGADLERLPSIVRSFQTLDGRRLTPAAVAERVLAALVSRTSAQSSAAAPWASEQRQAALDVKTLVGANGSMEVRFTPNQTLLPVRQDKLLDAAAAAQIHTFGWPIGVVLENREEFRPKPTADGIVAVVHRNAEKSFDYWSLRRDGGFYLMHSLFEDQRTTGALFFDTRIVRLAETLLYCRRLYQQLGLPDAASVTVGIRHDGLKGRRLSSASPSRMVFDRTTSEDSIDTERDVVLLDIDRDLVGCLKPFVDELLILFDFFTVPPQVLEQIVDSFRRGKVE